VFSKQIQQPRQPPPTVSLPQTLLGSRYDPLRPISAELRIRRRVSQPAQPGKTVRPTVEEWTPTTLERDAPDVLGVPRAWKAVKKLGLILVPAAGARPIEDFLLHVDGARASRPTS
jgi:hypothetical protein